jgi:putative ribosome biogenesis GTPase RsgA
LITCKKNLWNRWRREYLTALREKHNLTHQTTKLKVLVGDVVIVKSDDKNRGNWPLGIVQQVFPGKDGVIRAVKLKTAKGTLERPVQHLYPMELASESVQPEANTLNPDAKVFRPKRKAAEEADERIRKIAEYEQKQF